MTRASALACAVATVFAVVVLASACSRGDAPAAPAAAVACVPAEGVIDPALLAFLSKARAAHHKADLAEDAKDTPAAIAALEQITSSRRPAGATPPAEVAEVIADTRARLADLRSQAGDVEAALRDIDDGLSLAAKPTHFRGHLFEVKGVVLERRREALQKLGDAEGAERAKREAIDAYDRAIDIQNGVIADALREGGAPR